MKLILCLAVLVGIAVAKPNQPCKQGPSYWCQNEKNALECGVINFCKILKQEKKEENSKVIFHPKKFIPSTEEKFVLDAAPVNVSFYYESLCPGCREVWRDQVWSTYEKIGSSGIVNFEFVPFGNAQEQPYGSSWYFTCQHGPNECLGNIIESCAMQLNPEPSKHMPFLHCLEEYGPYTYGEYCAQLAKIDWAAINTCSTSDQGKQFEHQMALKTNSLNPPHQYVPWLNLNGQHTQSIQNGLTSDMLATVCNAYTGTKPAACVNTKPKVCLRN